MGETGSKAVKYAAFVAVTLVLGAFAGAFTWAFFFLMNAGITLLWEDAPRWLAAAGLPAVFYPVAFCTLGGLVIGLFQKRFGGYPDDMNTVLASLKRTGRYEYEHMGASFVGALLPLLFGGSIGPEAGLTGVIAGLCTWVTDRMKFLRGQLRDAASAGVAAAVAAIFGAPLFGLLAPMAGYADRSTGEGRAGEAATGGEGSEGAVADGGAASDGEAAAGGDRGVAASAEAVAVPRGRKLAAYLLAVAAALGAFALLSGLIGGGLGLPRFTEMSVGAAEILGALPVALVAMGAGWLYHGFGALAGAISAALGEHVVAKGVVAGLILGILGTALPFTLFAGEAQTEQLAGLWTGMGVGVLLATGFLKVLATQVCLGLGWRGGHFFPLIFASIAIGYGCAALLGIDPVFALCVSSSALLGVVMRQPVMTVLLLLLCFPVKGVVVMLAAAALGSLVPVPRRWQKERRP